MAGQLLTIIFRIKPVFLQVSIEPIKPGQYPSGTGWLESGTSHIIETYKKIFPGYHLFLVTAFLLNHNCFLFLRMWC